MVSRVFLDANVLLEIIYDRPKAQLVHDILVKNRGNIYISPLSVHLILYFGLRVANLKTLETFITDYKILSMDSHDIRWAFTNVRNNDFEDALQLAVAIRNGCDEFITQDKDLISKYSDLPTIAVRNL